MPAQYEAIKRSLLAKKVELPEAKKRAAMIYNAQRKPGEPPVTRGYDKKNGK